MTPAKLSLPGVWPKETLAPWTQGRIERVRLHTDLTILAQLACALAA